MRVWFERVAATNMPDVAPDDLKSAWATLIARARSNRHHQVTREQLSVRCRNEPRSLKSLPAGASSSSSSTMFAPHADIAHLVVTFLALLELAREQLIDIAQAEAYAPIYVNAKGERAFVLAGDA